MVPRVIRALAPQPALGDSMGDGPEDEAGDLPALLGEARPERGTDPLDRVGDGFRGTWDIERTRIREPLTAAGWAANLQIGERPAFPETKGHLDQIVHALGLGTESTGEDLGGLRRGVVGGVIDDGRAVRLTCPASGLGGRRATAFDGQRKVRATSETASAIPLGLTGSHEEHMLRRDSTHDHAPGGTRQPGDCPEDKRECSNAALSGNDREPLIQTKPKRMLSRS